MNFELGRMWDTVCGLFKDPIPTFAWKITRVSVSLAGLWTNDQILKFQTGNMNANWFSAKLIN